MKKRGGITLLSAMVFLLLIGIISMTLLSARIQGANVIVNSALNLGVDSMFSSYDTNLF